MSVAILFGTMLVFLLIGVPIGVCLLFPIFIMLMFDPITPSSYLANIMYTGAANSTLIAIPFFILSGDVMSAGGISKKLVDLADSCIGRITGSYGVVTVLSCMFFGAVSGSSPATVAAIGAIMIPIMIKKGYNKFYAVGLVTVAGALGIIVPPSYPMLIYGTTMNVSIKDLFTAGIGPSILVGGILMLINFIYCKKHGIRGDSQVTLKGFLHALWNSKWAILMPVIILGGIYTGIFTATESAVAAVVYGIIIGVFVYRAISFADVFHMFRRTAIMVGGTLLTIAPANGLGKIFTLLGVNDMVKSMFYSVSTNKFVILLMIYVVLFIAGMFLQTTPVIVIFGPVLLNVVKGVGIDEIQFGMIMIIALAIAFVTPPVAVNLFMSSSMTGVPVDKITKASLPFLIGMSIAMLLVGIFPQISKFLL